jgi:hypothetical protein
MAGYVNPAITVFGGEEEKSPFDIHLSRFGTHPLDALSTFTLRLPGDSLSGNPAGSPGILEIKPTR